MEKDERKQQLRKKHKKLRKALTEDKINEYSLKIANLALDLDIWKYEYYHIFLPIQKQKEVNTEYLLQVLQGRDKQVVLSKSDFLTKSMQHFLLTDSTRIVENEFGIPEPQNGIVINPELLDVVFIPLLAYDYFGNRVGYGQGFYDRFLAYCKPDVVKVGLSFFLPEKEKITASNEDIMLDCCISDEKIFHF